MKSIIEGCFKRPGAVILALVLIFFSGINAFLSIPKEASPDVEIPVAYVSVAYEGISPSDAEKLLTKPLEKQLKTVAGLKKMTSAAQEGYLSWPVASKRSRKVDLSKRKECCLQREFLTVQTYCRMWRVCLASLSHQLRRQHCHRDCTGT